MDLSHDPTRQNYRVTVRYKRVSREEADLKMMAIASVAVAALRRRGDLKPESAEGVEL